MRLVIPALLAATSCHAFFLPQMNKPNLIQRFETVSSSEEIDFETVKEQASRRAPPSSFFVLQRDAVDSVKEALKQNVKLMEIEFPPLPANVLEADDVSAYDISKANLRLAVDFARSLTAEADLSAAILLPDESELDIALDSYVSPKISPNLLLSALRRAEGNDDGIITQPNEEQGFGSGFLKLFTGIGGGTVQTIEGIDLYIILTCSAQELPDIEKLHELSPDTPIICFNLKLDTLRGDLGAPAFPGKDFQDKFLSRVKPVYYLRTRQYSRSIPSPPFILNYQGCLFRAYPGAYQTLLDVGDGQYRRIGSKDIRPALGEFKQELTDSLVMDGILEKESDTMNFFRTGYKTTTWWEEERVDASMEWRT